MSIIATTLIATQWPQLLASLASVLVMATVGGVVYIKTRRDRRHETASAEQRQAATEMHEVLVAADTNGATVYDGPTVGCDGPVSSYDEWLEQWKRRTQLMRPRLSPALRERVDRLTHLLERVASLAGGPYAWSLPIRHGEGDVERAVSAVLAGEPIGTPLLPEKSAMDGLIAQGSALNTGYHPLTDDITRRVLAEHAEALRGDSRRELRRGVILGVCGTVAVVNTAFLVARLIDT